jgi:23S rRNA-/tRNA-specific pseudouridylate synthase
MHQIRLQTGCRGFPILGDFQYGSIVPFGEQFDDERLRGILLFHTNIMTLAKSGGFCKLRDMKKSRRSAKTTEIHKEVL